MFGFALFVMPLEVNDPEGRSGRKPDQTDIEPVEKIR